MPNPFIGISIHQRLWIIYFIVTAVVLTIGTVIGFGVELNEIRVDQQQSGRVIYVGFLCAGGTALLIGIAFLFVPVDEYSTRKNKYSFSGSITGGGGNSKDKLLKKLIIESGNLVWTRPTQAAKSFTGL